MVTNTQRSFLLTIGLLFFLFGCDSERDDHYEQDNLLRPNSLSSENVQSFGKVVLFGATTTMTMTMMTMTTKNSSNPVVIKYHRG